MLQRLLINKERLNLQIIFLRNDVKGMNTWQGLYSPTNAFFVQKGYVNKQNAQILAKERPSQV